MVDKERIQEVRFQDTKSSFSGYRKFVFRIQEVRFQKTLFKRCYLFTVTGFSFKTWSTLAFKCVRIWTTDTVIFARIRYTQPGNFYLKKRRKKRQKQKDNKLKNFRKKFFLSC